MRRGDVAWRNYVLFVRARNLVERYFIVLFAVFLLGAVFFPSFFFLFFFFHLIHSLIEGETKRPRKKTMWGRTMWMLSAALAVAVTMDTTTTVQARAMDVDQWPSTEVRCIHSFLCGSPLQSCAFRCNFEGKGGSRRFVLLCALLTCGFVVVFSPPLVLFADDCRMITRSSRLCCQKA